MRLSPLLKSRREDNTPASKWRAQAREKRKTRESPSISQVPQRLPGRLPGEGRRKMHDIPPPSTQRQLGPAHRRSSRGLFLPARGLDGQLRVMITSQAARGGPTLGTSRQRARRWTKGHKRPPGPPARPVGQSGADRPAKDRERRRRRRWKGEQHVKTQPSAHGFLPCARTPSAQAPIRPPVGPCYPRSSSTPGRTRQPTGGSRGLPRYLPS